MKKVIFYIILFLSLFACEDVYRPEVRDVPEMPVIEARITNNPAFNYILLSKTTKFTDQLSSNPVDDAKIEVLKEDGTFYPAEHAYSGHYNFDHTLEPGKQYKLRIIFDNELYESNWEKMPPIPAIQNFYAEPYEQVQYADNINGLPSKYYVKGFQIYVDLPVSDDNKYYLFRWQSYLQFVISYNSFRSYEWISFEKTNTDNMASPSLHSSTSYISRHKLMFNTLDYLSYLDTADHLERRKAVDLGWIFEIDQYGQSQGAHQFFKDATEQLKAEGQLFDPMYSQIKGNITCTSNPEKKMLGVFDLNSVQRHQYYVTDFEAGIIYYHKLEPIFSIPDEGASQRIPPYFWQRKK